MKKILAIFILTALFPLIAFATSGACSGHGGVSCSSGRDSDGSVICNDGWRNSSVSYSSMVMCQGYSTPSTSYNYYTTPSYYPSTYSSYYPTTSTVYTPTIPAYESITNGYKSYGVLYCNSGYYEKNSSCIKAPEHSTAGYYTFFCDSGYTKDVSETKCENTVVLLSAKLNNICTNSYGFNSSYDIIKKDCSCNAGYIMSKSGDSYSCVLPTQACQDTYGPESYGDKDYCYCQSGYQMVTTNGVKQCTYSISCPTGTVNSNNQCIPVIQMCQTNYGSNATSTDKTNCICKTGYIWNAGKTSCVAEPKAKVVAKPKVTSIKKAAAKR